MAAINQIKVNIGTEQSPNYVLHDVNDKRISSTAVTTATHLLATDASLSAINPITAANLASVLGVAKSAAKSSGSGFIKYFGGSSGLYIFGAYSTDGTEHSCYLGVYIMDSLNPMAYSHRMDDGTACHVVSNTGGTLSVDNKTSGKTYKYYLLRLATL